MRCMAPAGQFPVFRLATLLARQLSVPFAAKIKKFAVDNPRFRRSVCMGTGRAYHTCQLRLRLWTLAVRQPRTLSPISDQAALDSGANLLGEAAVFGLGGLIIIFEVNRQANKQEDKVLEEASRWLALLVSLEELKRELALQQQDIDRLQITLRNIAPHHYPRADSDPSTSSVPSALPPPPTPEFSTSTSDRITPQTPECPPPTLKSECEPPPTAECPPPPTAECPPPPTSECPLPPVSECTPLLTSDRIKPQTPDCSPPPTSLDCEPPPTLTSECEPPPTAECPPPPTSECPLPPVSECTPSLTSDCR